MARVPYATLLISAMLAAAPAPQVVVIGATPAGVAAAVNAARAGVPTALYEELDHIGGMTSGGLSNTDFHSFESLGGTFREFMHRVEQHYVRTYGEGSPQHRNSVRGGYYEPKVARAVFESMLGEAGVNVHLRHRLQSARMAPPKNGRRRITAVRLRDLARGRSVTIQASVFIDATYEGDLLPLAGAAYALGCESKHEYGESLAFDEPNRWVQTYNFRVTLSRDPANRVPIDKPAGYRREDYAPLAEWLKAGRFKLYENPLATDPVVLKIRPMSNGKADFNDNWNCPISLSLENVNHPWVEGSPAERARIYGIYKTHSLGLFWFLANDPAVPDPVRDVMRPYGLPKDEYQSNGHWSPQLYVREGRRMIGEYVFREQDTQPGPDGVRAPLHKDSVAIGDYSLNCHGVYSPSPGVTVGHHSKGIHPFQLPYRILLPRGIDGLLVPVAVSATHVGYSALRMEPTWTALGQAAGVAAAHAVRDRRLVRDIDVGKLQAALHRAGAVTVYVADIFPPVSIPRPDWDPPGSFEARLMPWPPRSDELFLAGQHFGTRGFFHGLEQDSAGAPSARTRYTGIWSSAFPGHAMEPDRPMDNGLASRWLRMAGLPEAGELSGWADLKRGAFLVRMHGN